MSSLTPLIKKKPQTKLERDWVKRATNSINSFFNRRLKGITKIKIKKRGSDNRSTVPLRRR